MGYAGVGMAPDYAEGAINLADSSTRIPCIPAYCTHCGAIWESFFQRILVSGQGKLIGNNETCPICGGLGHTADGTYKYIEGAISILSGPTITYKNLLDLQNFLLHEQKLGRPIEETAEAVKKIEPAFADLFTPSCWSPSVKAALIQAVAAVLVGVLALYSIPNIKITPKTVIHQYGTTPVSELLTANPHEFVPPIPKARPTESEPNRAERRRQKSLQRQRKPQS